MVVLAPLTALLEILCAILPAARRRLVWLVLILALVTVALTPLTTEAGEWFYNQQPHPADILRTHADRGGWMIYFSAALVVVALLLAFLHVREGRSETRRIGAHLVVAILHWPSGFRPSSRSTGSATPALSRCGATNCPRPPASSPLATHLVGAVVALHVLPDPVEARCIRDRLAHR